MSAPNTVTIYAPKSAAKIAEAAQLIITAAKLLDNCGDKYVIALVEAVEGSEAITADLGKRLAISPTGSTHDPLRPL